MMAVLRLITHELRTRWRAWVILALLVGVTGGAVLTAAAGARRTASAYPRFLEWARAADALVGPAGSGIGGYDDALARLPGVAAIAPIVGLQALPAAPGGRLSNRAVVFAPLDGRFGHQLEIPKLLAGREPRPDRAGEVAVDQIAAQDLHLRVGSTLEMGAVAGTGAGPIRHLTEHVVGVMVTRGSVVPVTALDKAAVIVVSPALFRELGPRYQAFDGVFVKLRPGATLGALGRAAQALARSYPGTGGQVIISDEAVQAATVERSIRPQAVALALFALILAITALLMLSQVAARLLLTAAADHAALAAVGMTRVQLWAAGVAEVAIAAAAGAALACGAAIGASPLMPIGPARLAEPHPGLSVDVLVLAAGFAATVVLLPVLVAWPAWRRASARRSAQRDAADPARGRSRPAELLGGLGTPVGAVLGMRLALDPGPGRTATPARVALAGVALSAAAVAAAVTFGACLLRLVDTPRLYGQAWDVAVDLQFGVITPRQFDGIAAGVPGISGWTYGLHGTVTIGRTVVPAIGLAAGRGAVTSPTLLAGYPPRTENEIVLGTSVLRQTGRDIGQSLQVTAGGRTWRARIVGRAILPDFGEGSFTPTDLGEGAVVTAALLHPQAAAASGTGYNFVLVRFTPGPRRQADMADFERAMGPFCAGVQQATCVVGDQRPNGVTDYARIDGTPEVLAGILAVLGFAVLGQFMMVSTRRRRRDFAILKTLGLLRGQLRAVVGWQVTMLTGLGLAVGLPLGIASGHWAWALFAGGVGLSPDAITPVPLLLLMIPAALAVANLIALPPGRRSARLRPAAVLRAE